MLCPNPTGNPPIDINRHSTQHTGKITFQHHTLRTLTCVYCSLNWLLLCHKYYLAHCVNLAFCFIDLDRVCFVCFKMVYIDDCLLDPGIAAIYLYYLYISVYLEVTWNIWNISPYRFIVPTPKHPITSLLIILTLLKQSVCPPPSRVSVVGYFVISTVSLSDNIMLLCFQCNDSVN